MSSRYDELERLQRLRESGALTDEEFQAEKRRILGHGTAAPEPSAPTPVEEQPRTRLTLYLMLAGAALLVAAVVGLVLGRMAGGGGEEIVNLPMPDENVAAENLIEAEAIPDVRTLPADEQLARAFEAAFGGRGAAVVPLEVEGAAEKVRYTPGRLIWPSFGPVLVSEGKVEDAAHVSAGKVAVHYLKPAADRFELVRAFPTAVVAGSSGQIGHWSLSARFSNWPVIAAEGGGTWQGYTCTVLTLTELRPGGPVELATVPLSYDNEGALTDDGTAPTKIDGKILNVVRNQSFDVVYSGSRAFSEHWVRSGKGYAVAGGKSIMETC